MTISRPGPLTCTMHLKDGKQCPKDGAAIYRRPDEGCIYITCSTHDTLARQKNARELGYTRYSL